MDIIPLHSSSSSPSLTSQSLSSPSSPSSISSCSGSTSKKRSRKSHVPTACVNCKKAHLACDLSRPCKRCVAVGKTDTCYDIQHKKRGRPKLRDKRSSVSWKQTQIASNSSNNVIDSLQNSTHCIMAVVPALAPGFAHSCFTMTQPPVGYHQKIGDPNQLLQDQHHRPQVMTIFLSLDMRCARVSDESLEMIGLYPQELTHRSLYEWIMPDSDDVLARVHRCLLSARPPSAVATTALTTTSDAFATLSPPALLSIANGSQTFKEKLKFKRPDGTFELLDARFYLGGGLGADLFLPATLDQLYIVCLLTSSARMPPAATATEPARSMMAPTTTAPNTRDEKQQQNYLSRQHHPPRQHTQDDTAHHQQHELVWMQPHDIVYHHQHQTIPSSSSTASITVSNHSPGF